jgi:hypothetical protein
MSPFVESLRRLYQANRISIEKLNSLLNEEKISQTEYNYICSI